MKSGEALLFEKVRSPAIIRSRGEAARNSRFVHKKGLSDRLSGSWTGNHTPEGNLIEYRADPGS